MLTFDPQIDPQLIERVAAETSGFWPQRPFLSAYHDPNRIQDAWVHARGVRDLALHPNVLGILRQFYGKSPRPFQTLNFRVGTEQPAHSDTVHFNSQPFGAMCGVWIALQDIDVSCGPVIYYPGSHKLPEMNLPDFGLPASFDHYAAYERKLAELIKEKGWQAESATLTKGQALIWAANLLHGGAPRTDRSRERLSQVTHYYFRGDRYWRPRMSVDERYYYDPDWVSHNPLRLGALGARRLKTRLIARLVRERDQLLKKRNEG